MEKSHKHAHHGEGSVFLLKDSRRRKPWVAQVTLADGKKRQTYHATSKEAHEARRQMLHELEQGMFVQIIHQTVADYFDEWLAAKRLTLKDGTYEYYRKFTNWYILPALGPIRLQKLTSEDVQLLYTDLSKQIAQGTVRLVHRILCGALADAVKHRKLATNPCQTVTLPRVVKQELAYLTPEQTQHLLQVARGHSLECLLTLAVTTGMRLGELLALRWSDIDWGKKTLRVVRSVSYHNPDGNGYKLTEEEPKTASSRRTIPLPGFVVDALKVHGVRQVETRLKMPSWRNVGLVFTNDEGGHCWPKTIREQLRSLLEEAGLPAIRFHDLRHTAATMLLSLGVNPKVVQEWLGHSSITITLGIYGHVTESMRGEARDKLNELFELFQAYS